MEAPKFPENEKERLAAIDEYNILDTLPEQEFDNITRLASEICHTPISLITILDPERNWFKSHHGIDFNESPRDISFCGHAILHPDQMMIVADTTKDKRFADNPNVVDYNVHFYAGVPLTTPDGFPLGTLCIMDFVPRQLEEGQVETLKALANQAVNLFELRKANLLLQKNQLELASRNEELEQFAMVVSHDLKSPLSNISALIDMLKKGYTDRFDEEGKEILKYLSKSSDKLKNLIDGILEYYRSTKILTEGKGRFTLRELIEPIVELVDVNEDCEIEFPDSNEQIYLNKTSFQQILMNLLGNCIKYNDKNNVIINIGFEEDDSYYFFSVEDNGPGIDKEHQKLIFELFNNLGKTDRFNNSGNGIGLSTVKKLVEGHGGTIQVNPEFDKGTLIEFSLKK
mgnify:CR=1 FL=1